MPVTSLPCGCTLDTDFTSPEHQEKAPYHRKLKEDPVPLPSPEEMPLPEYQAEEEPQTPKKRR